MKEGGPSRCRRLWVAFTVYVTREGGTGAGCWLGRTSYWQTPALCTTGSRASGPGRRHRTGAAPTRAADAVDASTLLLQAIASRCHRRAHSYAAHAPSSTMGGD